MSSRNSYLLFSSCLSVIAFSVVMPAHAGFEWTPPTKEVKSAIPAPVQPKPVMQEPSKVDDAVMNHMEEMAVKEELMAPVDEKPMPTEKVMQSKTFVAQEEVIHSEAEEMEVAVEQHEVIEAVEKEAMIKEEVIEDQPVDVAEEDGVITIDPFPLAESQEVETEDTAQVIALPSDSEKPLEEMTAEDTVTPPVMEEEEVIEEAEVASVNEIEWNKQEIIEGFGFDMPLAIALGQIVPSRYAYSFGRGVNPGAVVSWEGGKPWHEVLKDALAPLDVTYAVKDKTIHIKSLASSTEEHASLPKEEDATEDVEVASINEIEKVAKTTEVVEEIEEPSSASGPVIIAEIDQNKPTPIASSLLQAQKKTLSPAKLKN